ncbi:MAG TPA: alkaline phosphatase family protein [Bacteroidales bacterium]|nr:alkaline phosphatase family protein [Bacteroidales bacterium]HOL97715.1 alkaline phosphatase family protein [Bacteroidales bacterium]HOM36332.1 alkaline phosphatase family protein [Bacteroidales bacterium]HPD23616.1 alkaline phosphatase family protein [Bacteroidales bacterium]HRS99471.1 alkaline phosphatase family protein [Bacteroidales bacterium]
MRKTIFTLILLLFTAKAFTQLESSIPSEKPKLVVGIVVEGIRQDYLDRFWNNFGNKGFKKLAINGSYCRNTVINYSLTQTAPGYASIATGTEPAQHGIVSNYWFNPITSKKEDCIEDYNYNNLARKKEKGSFSPLKMLSTTFADEAKLFHNGKSKIISISLNPYAAVLSGGYSADAAYWFDITTGTWTSSTYYMNDLPNWIKDINQNKNCDDYLKRQWDLSLEREKYTSLLPDRNEYEFGIDGVYKTFPYIYSEMTKTVKDYELITMIPEGNTHLNDLAIATIYYENLGKDDYTDFLFVNYSVSEKIGRLFGPQSLEIEDLLIKLDKDLAHLIEVIEDVVGKNNVLIYLTSNHGMADPPQYLIDNKLPAGFFRQHYVIALLKSYLRAIYGEGDWILDFNNSQIYLNKVLIEDSKIPMADFQEKVVTFISNFSGIANAISSNQFLNINFTSGIPLKMQNSFNLKRSGDIMISLRAGWIEDIPYCTDHNTGYRYDTHVPLIFYGWKVKKQTIYSEISISDIAPTISIIIGTPVPPLSTGNTLQEIFR